MGRPRRHAPADHGAGYRTARVGELVRRIVAEAMEELDDDRLVLVSVTGVEVDRDLHRAVVWFTSLADRPDVDAGILEAFAEHGPRLRAAVGEQARLRKTPKLVFRPDTVLRSAERIERLLDGTADPGSGSSGLSAERSHERSSGLSAERSAGGSSDRPADPSGENHR